MITTALLAIPLEFFLFLAAGWAWGAIKPAEFHGIVGGVRQGIEIGAILGVASCLAVFTALMLGLNHKPHEKVGGALACVTVLTLLLLQTIYFVDAWAKFGR